MRLPAVTFVLLISGAAQAQSPGASPDVAKLLQDLTRKVERLQADVDKLKKDKSKATPASPDPATVAASPPPAQERVGGGWAVGVYPWTTERRTSERVGRFIAPPGGFSFGEFRRSVAHPGWAFFKGEGLYNPSEAGRYVFSTRLSWQAMSTNYTIKCQTKVAIDDQVILENVFEGGTGRDTDRNASGGADMQPNVQNISFEVRCDFFDYYTPDSENVMAKHPELKAFFEKIKFTFGATGPNDMSVRAPTVRELVHDISGKKSP